MNVNGGLPAHVGTQLGLVGESGVGEKDPEKLVGEESALALDPVLETDFVVEELFEEGGVGFDEVFLQVVNVFVDLGGFDVVLIEHLRKRELFVVVGHEGLVEEDVVLRTDGGDGLVGDTLKLVVVSDQLAVVLHEVLCLALHLEFLVQLLDEFFVSLDVGHDHLIDYYYRVFITEGLNLLDLTLHEFQRHWQENGQVLLLGLDFVHGVLLAQAVKTVLPHNYLLVFDVIVFGEEPFVDRDDLLLAGLERLQVADHFFELLEFVVKLLLGLEEGDDGRGGKGIHGGDVVHEGLADGGRLGLLVYLVDTNSLRVREEFLDYNLLVLLVDFLSYFKVDILFNLLIPFSFVFV